MKKIIDPIAIKLIEKELTPEQLLRRTNKGGNEIYVVDHLSAPNTMREIGRLREIAFREGGGGTGKECDIDFYDTMDPPCRQLIVWDPETKEIAGGYRFILGPDIKVTDGIPRIATSHMFDFSEEFIRNYLPHTIELGRSFVRTEYQSTKSGAKAIFALDNLWDGLGALMVLNPGIKYLFGKVTMYPGYSKICRNMIIFFMNKHFPDPEHLVTPRNPLQTGMDTESLSRLFCGNNYREDYRILNHSVREQGLNIPPLINAYMGLSPTMKMFGTAINDEFGNVEESGIFITLSEVFEEKKKRHIGTYNEA